MKYLCACGRRITVGYTGTVKPRVRCLICETERIFKDWYYPVHPKKPAGGTEGKEPMTEQLIRAWALLASDDFVSSLLPRLDEPEPPTAWRRPASTETLRWCSGGHFKSRDEFGKNASARDGLKQYCRACCAAEMRAYQARRRLASR